MQQIVITTAGPTQKAFKLETLSEIPAPGEGQVRIVVKASGINFADIMARRGLYPDAPPLPTVVGYEVSGTIDAIGSGVPAAWIGKDVVAFTRFKGYATHVVTLLDYCVLKPESLSFIEAASIPVVYATAWILIYEMGGLRKDQSILIQNAGGGVGLAAIDIAKHLGAGLIIGTASAKKHDFLKQRGLHTAIDYRTEDVKKRVLEVTGGKGVDLIIDPIGGPDWNMNYSLLRPTGRMGVFGASTLATESSSLFSKISALATLAFSIPRWTPLSLMDQNKGVFGVNLGHMWDEKEKIQKYLSQILSSASAEGDLPWIHPHIDSVFSFEDVALAHDYVEARKNIGKVVLVPTKEDVESWKALAAASAK